MCFFSNTWSSRVARIKTVRSFGCYSFYGEFGDMRVHSNSCDIHCSSSVTGHFSTHQTFWGVAGYCTGFCRKFSTIIKPLTDLIKNKVKYIWSSACQQAFDYVKRILVNLLIWWLKKAKPFKLQVDGSHVGAGGVLLQENDFGIDKPVSLFSKKFNKHQLNYSVVKKRSLGSVFVTATV